MGPNLSRIAVVAANRFGGNLTVFADIFEANTDAFGDTRLLHRDPVQGRCGSHGFLRVRYDDKPCPAKEALEDIQKTANVGFVKRSVDFVQNTKGAGPKLENGHQQGDRGQRFLTTAEQ